MNPFKWLKDRLSHKLDHFRWSNIKSTMKEHGLALVVIVVAWEIIEDVLFPVLFVFLGNYVHPAFYAGVPAAWLLCLHWLAVPLIWGWWMRFKGEDKKLEHDCGE
ncbi:MAG: hypothetical protein CML56_04570 [Rhodobacteraceae bacterium]|nr:hypothetical protein [Paracoccaceae bacterium]